jgi:hypothetical protein
LPDFPKKLLENVEPLPMIYGLNNQEGVLLFGGNFFICKTIKKLHESQPYIHFHFFLALMKNIMKLIREDFSVVLKYNFKMEPAKLSEVSAKVKQYFFGDKEVGPDTVNQLVDVIYSIVFKSD